MAGAKGRAKWARSSMGRRVLILVLVRAFQGRGPVRGFFHLVGLRESEALYGYGEGKDLGRRAAAAQTGDRVQASVTAASFLLWASRSSSGGRAASTASILIGVVVKQFVTHHWTLCQKTSSFWTIALFGTKRSAP